MKFILATLLFFITSWTVSGQENQKMPIKEDDLEKTWAYDGSFHKLIKQADQIVIRRGGYDCCAPVDKQSIFIKITNPKEIKQFNQNIQFEKTQSMEVCMCCGYPGIDWYKGKKRIALTAIQHGFALRWRGFGDARFTRKSAKWLCRWLVNHDILGVYGELLRQATGGKLEQMLPILIAALEKDKTEVKITAARILGRIGPKAEKAVPALLNNLKNNNPNVKIVTARTLGL